VLESVRARIDRIYKISQQRTNKARKRETWEMTHLSETPFNHWVETAHHLGRRSPETVACPCCSSTSLSVRDVEYGFGHDKGVQRYITCGCCGAFTGVIVRRAGEAKAEPGHTAN
jgi:hypothetical protein